MKYISSFLLFFTLSYLSTSCGKQQNKNIKALKKPAHNTNNDNHRSNRNIFGERCHLQQIIDLSDSGNKVLGISLNESDRNIELINIKDAGVIAKLDYFTFIKASPNFKYFILVDSLYRYSVWTIHNKQLKEIWRLPIFPSDYPNFEFSADEKNLLVRYRYSVYNKKSKNQIYDLKDFQLKYEWVEPNTKFSKITKDGKYNVILSEDINAPYLKEIIKIDIKNQKEIFRIPIRSTKLTSLFGITDNQVYLKYHDKIHFYALENGKFLDNKKMFYIWDVNNSNQALASLNTEDLVLMDMANYNIIQEVEKGLNILSSCRFRGEREVVCRTDDRPDTFSEINFDTLMINQFCL